MRKFVITFLFLILSVGFVSASDLTDDYFDIATGYCIDGNYQKAIEYLDKILINEPSNKSLNDLKRGLQLLIQGKNTSYVQSSVIKEAINAKFSGNKEKELSLLSSSNDFWANYFLGEYYKQNKKYAEAIQCYIKSVNQKPTFIQCYLQIAICYYEQKNYNQVMTYLNQYLKSNLQDDYAYYLRAKSQSALGNYSLAYDDILKAISLENSQIYSLEQAKILYNLKEYERSKEILLELSKNIQTSEIYQYIGMDCLGLGDKPNAILNLDKASTMSDNNPEIVNIYNSLRH